MKTKNHTYFNKINFYSRNGYLKIKLFSKKDITSLKNRLKKKIQTKIPGSEKIKLEYFHKLKISKNTKKKIFLPKDRYLFLTKSIRNKINKSKILKYLMYKSWGHKKYSIKWIASLKKKQIKNDVCGFRISEPGKQGVGAHIDLHVGGVICDDKNVLKSIWVPLTAFNKRYTLNFSPKSHLIDHPINQFERKKKIISNVFKEKYVNKFKFKQLDFKVGEVLIFHPNLLHGKTVNQGELTRSSLEIRLYNSKNNIIWKNKI